MNILLIGYGYDIDLAYRSVRPEHQTTVDILGNYTTDAAILNDHALSLYDSIVIAIKEPYQAKSVYDLLRSILQRDDMIIDFYELYYASLPPSKVDRVMANPFHSSYNGMILGISHAEVGILSSLFDGCFCNLAVSSQDIYYNMKTLQYCIDHYRNKLQCLRYLIFDMFDYTYFNYDVSLSKVAMRYYSTFGGFRHDPHHFQDNPSFSMDHDDLLLAMFSKLHPHLDARKLELWDKLFENVHIHDDHHGFNEYSYEHLQIHLRTKIVTDEEINAYRADSSIVQKIYPATIKENIQHFYDLLRSAYSIDPDIKIFCILMPRYHKAYEKVRSMYAPWKERFYAVIKETQQAYPYTFLDLTEDPIAKKREYYFNPSHFNYYGAIQFSQYLNSILSI